MVASRPSWGAWIETGSMTANSGPLTCRAPRGARGLKPLRLRHRAVLHSRAPRGARGLKRLTDVLPVVGLVVAPLVGARGLKHGGRRPRSEERRVGKECRSRW